MWLQWSAFQAQNHTHYLLRLAYEEQSLKDYCLYIDSWLKTAQYHSEKIINELKLASSEHEEWLYHL